VKCPDLDATALDPAAASDAASVRRWEWGWGSCDSDPIGLHGGAMAVQLSWSVDGPSEAEVPFEGRRRRGRATWSGEVRRRAHYQCLLGHVPEVVAFGVDLGCRSAEQETCDRQQARVREDEASCGRLRE
jgi:hypothetical protein